MIPRKTIPCILNSCLLLPICKSKEEINCEKLVKYLYYINNSVELQDVQRYKAHNEISGLFSNINRVFHYKNNSNYFDYEYIIKEDF